MSTELLPCPFCGCHPSFPEIEEVFGTYYEAGCEDCGYAWISIGIIDCFDYTGTPSRNDVHISWDKEKIKFGNEFIEIARNEAISRWNTRHEHSS